jgi:hypothetical protein
MKRLFIHVVFCCSCVGAFAQQIADIHVRDGKAAVRVEAGAVIDAITWEGVAYHPKGTSKLNRTFEIDAVLRIEYAEVPEAWTRILSLAREGQWAAATTALAAVVDDAASAKSAPWVKEEALFLSWQIAMRRGQTDPAKAAADRLRTDFPKSRYFPEIDLADAHRLWAAADVEGAKSSLKRIATDAICASYPRSVKYRAWLTLCDIAAEKPVLSDIDTLLAEFKIATDAITEARPYGDILEGKRRLAKKEFADAKQIFTKVLDMARGDDAPIVAHASIGLATAVAALGDLPRAALDASRAPSIFYEDGRYAHEVGIALWRWAAIYRQWAQSIAGDDDPQKKICLQRYRQLRRQASQDFSLLRGGRLAKEDSGS